MRDDLPLSQPTPRLFGALVHLKFRAFLAATFKTLDPGRTFSDAPYLHILADHVERIERGQMARSYVNAPPRCGKSITLTAAHIAWRLGRNPRTRIILASYSMDLAIEQLKRVRRIMEAKWYRQAFPYTIAGIGLTDGLISTQLGGYARATSVDGLLTGTGGDLIIMDDIIKADDALRPEARAKTLSWFRSTVATRLDDPKTGAILLVMQRLHEQDLTAELRDTGRWSELSLSLTADVQESYELLDGHIIERQPGDVLDPERMTDDWVELRKAEMGSYHFLAQCQQRPTADGLAIFKPEWFKRRKRIPTQGQITISIDAGVKTGPENDFTVLQVWKSHKNRFYLMDVIRVKVEMPGLVKLVRDQCLKHSYCELLVEDAANGSPLIQTLRGNLKGADLISVRPKGDKFSRALACIDIVESGRVHIPADAPWVKDFEDEVRVFPGGRNDDQVDAMSQYLGREQRKPDTGIPVAPITVTGDD
ncbi:phage terminase large subunit [Hyphobacterium sp.]|uniref:phage terminase large subunit n=1 Tax=Hyphobacterium sp. TaxID=2004662 RepID=UPI00374A6EB5